MSENKKKCGAGFDTPLGRMVLLAVCGAGAPTKLTGLGFAGPGWDEQSVLLDLSGPRGRRDLSICADELAELAEQVFTAPEAVPLSLQGTDFQMRVWNRLKKIPAGTTASYGDIARDLGSSPRAVGRAVGSNPISLLIPCHRVIGASGDLHGYRWGLGVKQRLLAREGVNTMAGAGV